MNTQTRTTLTLGSGDAGIQRSKRWRKFAREHGYHSLNEFITEAVEWILRFSVWKRGRGVIGVAKPQNTPAESNPRASGGVPVGGTEDE